MATEINLTVRKVLDFYRLGGANKGCRRRGQQIRKGKIFNSPAELLTNGNS
jgi:hypothetical protein